MTGSARKIDPEWLVRHKCKDPNLRALIVSALHQRGTQARCTNHGVMITGPLGSVVINPDVRGGDPNQLKRTRGQLRRIGLAL